VGPEFNRDSFLTISPTTGQRIVTLSGLKHMIPTDRSRTVYEEIYDDLKDISADLKAFWLDIKDVCKYIASPESFAPWDYFTIWATEICLWVLDTARIIRLTLNKTNSICLSIEVLVWTLIALYNPFTPV
jgi:hypothetical protein